MSTIQNLAQKLLPKKLAAAMEAESRQWIMACPCGHERSVWEAGGIRYKASGRPKKRLPCPACGQTSWHQLEYREKA